MKLLMRFSALFFLMVITLSVYGYFYWLTAKSITGKKSYHSSVGKKDDHITNLRLKQKGLSVLQFANENNFNATRCFLADMKIFSGNKRFFVYNLQKDSIEMAGLVAHGSGSDTGGGELFFSNTPNSNCTSLGKYKIGKSYMGKFGLAYKLVGLDNTNNKAFERFVVLHAHSCVPNENIAPVALCESWGCPTVSPDFLNELKIIISRSDKPIILWIYN